MQQKEATVYTLYSMNREEKGGNKNQTLSWR